MTDWVSKIHQFAILFSAFNQRHVQLWQFVILSRNNFAFTFIMIVDLQFFKVYARQKIQRPLRNQTNLH